MPTILRHGPYRFSFYASDGPEPPHVHITRDQAVAKVWLISGSVQSSKGFTKSELNEVLKLVEQFNDLLLENWYGYFND